MSGRYIRPVSFTYEGNKAKGRTLEMYARGLIKKELTRARADSGRRHFHRSYALDNGTTIRFTISFKLVVCTIYVPIEEGDELDYAGFIVYPYEGYMYHARQFRHVYYGDTSSFDARDLARPLFVEWPGGYYFKRTYGWKPPYVDPNGNAIKEDGTNLGKVLAEEPAYPRWLIPATEDVIPLQKWRQKFLTKDGDPAKYRPDDDTERWWESYQSHLGLGGPNTQREHEKWYKTTAHWKSKDEEWMVHYEGHPGGDVGLVTESIMTDGITQVFVNGVMYEAPMPVIAACVMNDSKSGTDWLVCWLVADTWGEPGTDIHDTSATFVYCRLRNGKKPTWGKIWEPTEFSLQNFKQRDEAQYDWFAPLDGMVNTGGVQDYVAGGWEPQIQTNKSHYDTYGTPSAQTHERWVVYPRQRISVDSTGSKWTSTWVTDGGSGSQWNEFSNTLTVNTQESGGVKVHTPAMSVGALVGGNDLMTTNALAWNTWLDCGTVVVNVVYDELDVRQKYEMNLMMKIDGDGVFPTDHDNMDLANVTAAHYKMTLTFDGNTWDSTIDTDFLTYYTGTAEWPVYYDLKAEDAVIERMPSMSITQWDPGTMIWTYGREVYIRGVLQTNKTGSSSYVVPATEGIGYTTRPYYNFGNWFYPLPSGPFTWRTEVYEWQYRCPAPMAMYMPYYVPNSSPLGPNLFSDYDTHPGDLWRPFWPQFFKNSEPPGFEVHESPGGHRMGYYVDRSLSAVESWLDSTDTSTYGDGLDENFRVAPTYFIDGPKTLYSIMKTTSMTDGDGKIIVPIVDVFYYRRKDQDTVSPWRTKP